MKKIIILLLILAQLLTLTGCWDLNEPEDLALVIAFGAEYFPEEKKYRLQSQIINPLSMASDGGGGGGGGSGEASYWTVAGEGRTIFAALNNLRRKTSRRFYYGHTQLEIYSEEMAETEGILPVMDALERTRQTRSIIVPVVARGDIEDLLTRSMPIEQISSQGMKRQLEISNKEIGGTINQPAELFLNKLSTPGIEPVAAYIEPREEEEAEEEEGKSPLLKVNGLAAFKNDKLAGFLDNRETQGYNWITGRVNNTFLDVTLPGKEGEYASIRATIRTTELKPVIKEEKPEIDITVHVQGSLENVTTHVNIKKESKLHESLNRRLSQSIRNDIKSSIERAQELESDIFGFGRSFYRQKPQKWREMEDNWEEIFQQLPVNIDVEADIKETGLINKSIKPR